MDPVFQSINDEAQGILRDERELFNELIVELSMFATSPSPVITPLADPPIEDGLAKSLRTLMDILCRDGTRTYPTLAELKKVNDLIYFCVCSNRARRYLNSSHEYAIFSGCTTTIRSFEKRGIRTSNSVTYQTRPSPRTTFLSVVLSSCPTIPT